MKILEIIAVASAATFTFALILFITNAPAATAVDLGLFTHQQLADVSQ